ncbi:MAG: nitrogen fixation protein NifS, partial [Pseudomonadota bacterium]
MSADSASTALDIDFVRAQFPAFDGGDDKGGDDIVFMENAGGSYAARATVDRLTHFYTRTKVQPYGPFRASAE